MINWYTFNVTTLCLMCSLVAVCWFVAFITFEERKKLKREREQLRKEKMGRRI